VFKALWGFRQLGVSNFMASMNYVWGSRAHAGHSVGHPIEHGTFCFKRIQNI